MKNESVQDRILGCMLGCAVGDALGTTQEFVPMHYAMEHPIEDMVGQGKFKLEPGMWTDDTSMMLCQCESLLELSGTFDGRDQQKRYYEWYMNGHLSSNGTCFDIGKTTVKHLLENLKADREFHPHISDGASGNGALMRLAPVPLYYMGMGDMNRAIEMSGQSTMTTHPSIISRDCCRYYAALIIGAVLGESCEKLLSSSELYVPPGLDKDYWESNPLRSEVLEVVSACSYQMKNPPEIHSSAYVVRTMEAALWAFYHTDNFKDGALKLVNLGDDADTAGCIYGMLAGAFYGRKGIPEQWEEKIVYRDLIRVYANELFSVFSHSSRGDDQWQASVEFKETQELLYCLESEYQHLRRRILPGPSMFKTVEDFDRSVDKFYGAVEEKATSLQNLSSEVKSGLLDDFRKRIEVQDRPIIVTRTSAPSNRMNLLGALKSFKASPSSD